MLTTHDVANLFQSMRTAYGNQWKHGPEAMSVWTDALKRHKSIDVRKAAVTVLGYYVDFPPSLPQFMHVVRESTPCLPSPNHDDWALVARVNTYCRSESKINQKGNPHNVTLPESIARRATGESSETYEKRIGDEVTFALYPQIRRQPPSTPL